MKKTFILLASALMLVVGCKKNQDADEIIGKPDVVVENGRFTPEIMWQLGKMGEDPEDYASIWAYTHGETEPRFGLYVYPDFGFATTDRVSNLELE